jgi:hypothetical protein
MIPSVFTLNIVMMKTAYDPFGNAIVLSDELAPIISLPNSTVRIDAALVIAHPAMMFETTDGSFERYYLRTVEWDNLVLIRAKKSREIFIADLYLLNPPIEHIQELIKKCKQTK